MAATVRSITRQISSTTVSSDTIAVTRAAGSNLCLAALIGLQQAGTPGVTVSSVVLDPTGLNLAFTLGIQGDQCNSQGDNLSSEIWHLKNAPSGTHNVVVTLSGSTNKIGTAIYDMAGVDTTTPIRSGATTKLYANSFPQAPPFPSSKARLLVPGTVTGDIVLSMAVCWNDTTDPTVNSPQTGFVNTGAASNETFCDSYAVI